MNVKMKYNTYFVNLKVIVLNYLFKNFTYIKIHDHKIHMTVKEKKGIIFIQIIIIIYIYFVKLNNIFSSKRKKKNVEGSMLQNQPRLKNYHMDKNYHEI